MSLIKFPPNVAGDGDCWVRPQDVVRITKSPNRQKAARVYFTVAGIHEDSFETKLTTEEAAHLLNEALAKEAAADNG